MRESVVFKHSSKNKRTTTTTRARKKKLLSNYCEFFNTHTYIVSVMTRLPSYVVIFTKALIRYLCSY